MQVRIFLIACGRITNLNLLKKVKPNELPASHCAFLIELIPALNISAWKALSLIASAIIPDVQRTKT